ncbi:class I SAM-dependent methyltransferase [Fuerstiella marisgermanici]|uniref:Bifunctional 3-demethylubiquinone-9 3-methyltransferase/ 2-octaprenyl-6-hydroxy phenol methylase n=1 Tax=Fuerstiella marisgermanici TaxID=1891926 RepID=A0A1P8WA51_9PLAN|nr:class I SAM-dependent methyltransferase [Fuerstiella marisgermanici]APZ90921.1 bifunctional 3-demethylubiquinone-9 3-methyltransferase/ 2-octaprenyl-6-hydroxy phenol methylase [Fuerstiella marisgermanici]
MTYAVDCYDHPQYWDLAFGEDTKLEADFIVAAAKKYCDFEPQRLLEPGCGGGRLLLELASRGYLVEGWDLSEAAVQYANQQLAKQNLQGQAAVADMQNATPTEPADVAYCLVNTFRHLLTEESAIAHLKTVAAALRPGGLYIVGMHMLPPDADEDDEEEWAVEVDDVTIEIKLDVTFCCRRTRRETLRFEMIVKDSAGRPQHEFQTDYDMRLYEAEEARSLFEKVGDFELLDVYDFWYDIDEPLELSDELGDTVFVLRRK